MKKKPSTSKCELDLARLERLAVRLAEDREEDFADGLAARGDRRPVDVEVVEEARVLAVFENAHPPRVLRTGRHVIRDDVEEQSEVAAVATRRAAR